MRNPTYYLKRLSLNEGVKFCSNGSARLFEEAGEMRLSLEEFVSVYSTIVPVDSDTFRFIPDRHVRQSHIDKAFSHLGKYRLENAVPSNGVFKQADSKHSYARS